MLGNELDDHSSGKIVHRHDHSSTHSRQSHGQEASGIFGEQLDRHERFTRRLREDYQLEEVRAMH